MYVTIAYFEDAQDEHNPYAPGDIYPRDGIEPTKERYDELSTDKNVRRKPLIRFEPDPPAIVPDPPKKRRVNKNADIPV